MTRYVVDASVAVKWFIPEENSEFAILLLNDESVLESPDLLGAEFGNILWKKIRLREITYNKAERIVKTFLRMPIKFHSSRDLLGTAVEIAAKTGCTAYDSLYLALAVISGGKLVTADKRLIRLIAGTRLADHAVSCEQITL